MRSLDQGGWRRTNETLIQPPQGLGQFVDYAWVDEWTDGRRPVGEYRIVADGAPHIVCNAYSERHRGYVLNLVGARRVHHDVDVSVRRFTLGFRLKPGAIPALFSRTAERFTDRSVPLLALAERNELADLRRFPIASPEAALRTLIPCLERLAERAAPIDWRAQWLESRRTRHDLTASHAASEFGLSARALRAWSVRALGMGLKHFMKIQRLQAALDLHVSGAETRWSRVAATAGYTDQSHLVRDCRALLGEPPSVFVARAGLYKRGSHRRR